MCKAFMNPVSAAACRQQLSVTADYLAKDSLTTTCDTPGSHPDYKLSDPVSAVHGWDFAHVTKTCLSTTQVSGYLDEQPCLC